MKIDASQPAPVAIILAAGKGTRMKSDLAKVLHPVLGKPMIEHVLNAVRGAGVQRIVVVVGHQAGAVKQALSKQPGVEFALQAERLGTGHAVMMCAEALATHKGPVLVLAGDTPLLRSQSLADLLATQRKTGAACVVGTAETENNQGLGRIVRDADGTFLKIVEQRDATPEIAAIREINTGCFAFDCRPLFEALKEIRPENTQAEYYLTDCAEILRRNGYPVVAQRSFDIAEAMGVNTVEQLAEVERAMKSRQ